MVDRSQLTTNVRSIGQDGELDWGDQEHPWEEEVDSSSGVTVENGVVQPTAGVPDSVVCDFESGDLSRWDVVNSLSADSSRRYRGSYSGYSGPEPASGNVVAETVISGYEGGVQPSLFEYYWQEATNSGGCGIQLLNSKGDVEVGLATNNPQWVIQDENGTHSPSSSDGYNRWVVYTITNFDWGECGIRCALRGPSVRKNVV